MTSQAKATSTADHYSLIPSTSPQAGAGQKPSKLEIQDKPTNCFSKALYWITRPFALCSFYPLTCPCLLRCKCWSHTPKQSRELLADLGGESVQIKTDSGDILDAVYFDPVKYAENHPKAFAKWKEQFATHEYTALAELLEIDLDGKDFASLMGLPSTIKETGESGHLGVVLSQGAGQIYEFDPQGAIMYLMRKKHVLIFNYGGIMERGKGTPGWKSTCDNTVFATKWMKEKLKCENTQLLVHGKSMGTGPAVWTGTQVEGADVVIDRGFSSMPEVAETRVCCCCRPAARSMTHRFYRYPNNDFVPHIKGRVLIMQAKSDTLIPASHAPKLLNTLTASKLGHNASPEEVEAFKKAHFIEAFGSHSSKSGGDKEYAWYRDADTHAQLDRFLDKKESKKA
jgi:hypothetical protein